MSHDASVDRASDDEEQQLWHQSLWNDLQHHLPPGNDMEGRHIINVSVDSLMGHGYNVMQNLRLSPEDSSHALFRNLSSLVQRVVSDVTTQLIINVLKDNIPLQSLTETYPCQHSQSISINNVTSLLDCKNIALNNEEQLGSETERSSSDTSEAFDECRDEGKFGNRVSPRLSSRKKHCVIFTKNVPAKYAYCQRGVRCMLCFDLFKGRTCVNDLVEHTKQNHKSRATTQFLKKLRRDCAPSRIIGNGMEYCECNLCQIVCKGSIWDSSP